VTRSRPPSGPAATGAVDLSALKASGDAAGKDSAELAGVEITEANFEDEVLRRSRQMLVVVLLWSPRIDASIQLVDSLSGLVTADNGKWSLARVNVEKVRRVAQAFNVRRVPTVVALAAGQPVSSFQGPRPPDQLRRWLNSLLSVTADRLGDGTVPEEPEQVDPALAKAREQLNDGDLAAALDSYQAILDGDPNHGEAKGAVCDIAFLMRATAQRPDAIAIADAAPDDIEAALAAADVQLLNQDVPGAFGRLIALVRRTSGGERTLVRTRMLELFELFDAGDPDVIAARRNLANALY
jgi:putative thioredoxin